MCVRELKNEQRQSTLRETASKFLKRSTAGANPNLKANNSLEFSQSKNRTQREHDESLRLELSKVNPKENSRHEQKVDSKPVSSRIE